VASATLALLGKELRSMLREPVVLLSILLPFIVYSSMAPFYGQLGEQVREAATLKGVRIAVADCGLDPAARLLVRAAAERLAAGNVSVTLVGGCNGTRLLLEGGYDVVVVLSGGLARLNATLYIRGSLETLVKTLNLPGAVASRLGQGLTGGNMTGNAYVYMNGRLYRLDQLTSLFNTAISMSYAALFVLFPAAAAGASLVGAEREERTLEVLLSLPVPRRSIALSKALTAIVIAGLTAVSALAGLLNALRGAGFQLRVLDFYGVDGLAVYGAALLSEALFAISLAMIAGLFASTMRGAQAAASIAVMPAIIPPLMLLSGVQVSAALAAVPYMAVLLASLSPLTGVAAAAVAALLQAVEAAVALALLVRLLGSEAAVAGPETVRRLSRLLRRGR